MENKYQIKTYNNLYENNYQKVIDVKMINFIIYKKSILFCCNIGKLENCMTDLLENKFKYLKQQYSDYFSEDFSVEKQKILKKLGKHLINNLLINKESREFHKKRINAFNLKHTNFYLFELIMKIIYTLDCAYEIKKSINDIRKVNAEIELYYAANIFKIVSNNYKKFTLSTKKNKIFEFNKFLNNIRELLLISKNAIQRYEFYKKETEELFKHT